MTDPYDTGAAVAALVVLLVYLLLLVGVYLWYAIALSKLFPKLGAEAWKGWVPILNEMEILIRGSVPAWSIVFAFIPFVNLYYLYLKGAAAHRIGARFGRGAGTTVLAILLPPVWASLLAAAKPLDGTPLEQRVAGYAPHAPVGAAAAPPVPAGWPGTGGTAAAAPAVPGAPVPPPPPPPAPAVPGTSVPPPLSPPPAPLAAAPAPAAPPPPPPPAPAPAVVAPAPAVVAPSPAVAAPPPAAASAPPLPPVPPVPPASSAASNVSVPAPPPPPVPPVSQAPAAFPEEPIEPAVPDAPVVAASPWAPRQPASVPETIVARPAEVVPPPPAPSAPAADDDLGETIVVDRRPRIRARLDVDGGQTIAITGAVVVLGRKPTSGEPGVQDIAIADTTRTLSKVHARLDRHEDGWVITDLDSTNGVVVVAPDGTETLLDRGASAPVTARFILGKVAMTITEEGGRV